jgi:hypothetical protein
MYGSHGAGCQHLTWAKPHLLLFENNFDLYALNPVTRRVTNPALMGEYVVSPNARWIAGDNANGGPEAPQNPVYALTVNNSECLIVPLAPHQTDAVAGFTPDSKSLIVSTAPWNGTSNPPPGPTRLRQFRLSSLHTKCRGAQFSVSTSRTITSTG